MFYFAIGLLVGVLIGVIYNVVSKRKLRASGTFVMDFSDPLKDICRLDLAEDLNSIYEKPFIVLEVKTHGSDSQY